MNEAKDHFELIFNTIPDSIIVTNIEDGNIISANEGFKALTGYADGEFINKTTLDLNIWKKSEDRKEVIEEVAKNGFTLNKEYTFLSKTGKEIEGLFSSKIIISNGVPYMLSVTRDITERKQIEDEISLKNNKLEDANAEKDRFFPSWHTT
jgi:PAS domain S-box-containing protein